jgi:hypothetical protein
MPPGTVPLGPACQPVPPPSTMVTAHRSAHLPPPLFGRSRDVARPRHPRAPRLGRSHAARAVPHRSGPCPLSARSLFHAVPHTRALTSPLPRPPPLQKSQPPRRTLFSSPLTLLRARPSEPPLVHAGDRATAALLGTFPTTAVAIPPSTVRPANPPPFPYLGPPLLSRPPSQLPELAKVAADPPSDEDVAVRCRTEPPLRPVIAPPPR